MCYCWYCFICLSGHRGCNPHRCIFIDGTFVVFPLCSSLSPSILASNIYYQVRRVSFLIGISNLYSSATHSPPPSITMFTEIYVIIEIAKTDCCVLPVHKNPLAAQQNAPSLAAPHRRPPLDKPRTLTNPHPKCWCCVANRIFASTLSIIVFVVWNILSRWEVTYLLSHNI